MSLTLYSVGHAAPDPFGMFDKSVVFSPEAVERNGKGAMILWGGEDISPSIYNQANTYSYAPDQPSRRDVLEMRAFNWAVEHGIPIIGICRGAQLACALSGGALFQHIEGGHHQDHKVETLDGKVLVTSSCHHQALDLRKVEHTLLAWDFKRETNAWQENPQSIPVVIPEVAHLTSCNVLAIQGHPEWMKQDSRFVQECVKYIEEFLL